MTLTEKAAYIKGLMDASELDKHQQGRKDSCRRRRLSLTTWPSPYPTSKIPAQNSTNTSKS